MTTNITHIEHTKRRVEQGDIDLWVMAGCERLTSYDSYTVDGCVADSSGALYPIQHILISETNQTIWLIVEQDGKLYEFDASAQYRRRLKSPIPKGAGDSCIAQRNPNGGAEHNKNGTHTGRKLKLVASNMRQLSLTEYQLHPTNTQKVKAEIRNGMLSVDSFLTYKVGDKLRINRGIGRIEYILVLALPKSTGKNWLLPCSRTAWLVVEDAANSMLLSISVEDIEERYKHIMRTPFSDNQPTHNPDEWALRSIAEHDLEAWANEGCDPVPEWGILYALDDEIMVKGVPYTVFAIQIHHESEAAFLILKDASGNLFDVDIPYERGEQTETPPYNQDLYGEDYRIVVAGGRDFANFPVMRTVLDRFIMRKQQDKPRRILIVSGKSRGGDTLGEQYAKERGYPVIEMPADWDTLGDGAGFARNEDMGDIAHAAVCFWDGKSYGTHHMINTAKAKGLDLLVVDYLGNTIDDSDAQTEVSHMDIKQITIEDIDLSTSTGNAVLYSSAFGFEERERISMPEFFTPDTNLVVYGVRVTGTFSSSVILLDADTGELYEVGIPYSNTEEQNQALKASWAAWTEDGTPAADTPPEEDLEIRIGGDETLGFFKCLFDANGQPVGEPEQIEAAEYIALLEAGADTFEYGLYTEANGFAVGKQSSEEPELRVATLSFVHQHYPDQRSTVYFKCMFAPLKPHEIVEGVPLAELGEPLSTPEQIFKAEYEELVSAGADPFDYGTFFGKNVTEFITSEESGQYDPDPNDVPQQAELPPGLESFDVVDVETSGLDMYGDRIIELAIFRFRNGEVVSSFNTIVKFEGTLSAKAREMTSHTEEELSSGMDEDWVLTMLMNFMTPPDGVENHYVVAYNALFDFEMLATALDRYGYGTRTDNGFEGEGFLTPDTWNFIDPLTIARDRHKYPHKLADVCWKYGVPLEQAHSAYFDALATGMLLLEMHRENPNTLEYVNVAGYNQKYEVPKWVPHERTVLKPQGNVVWHDSQGAQVSYKDVVKPSRLRAAGTTTGRVGASEPNAANTPKAGYNQEDAIDALKQYYGLPPYAGGENIVRYDTYFAQQIKDTFGMLPHELALHLGFELPSEQQPQSDPVTPPADKPKSRLRLPGKRQ